MTDSHSHKAASWDAFLLHGNVDFCVPSFLSFTGVWGMASSG